MSPEVALHDPIFQRYLVLVAALLLLAGIILAILRFGFRIEIGNVIKTYFSWLWLAPLAVVFIFAGRVCFIAGVSAVALLALREFARATQLVRGWSVIVCAAILFAGLAAIFRLPAQVVLGAVIVLALLAILVKRKISPGDFSLGMLALIFFGAMFSQLCFLANSSSAYGYLCFLLFATEVNDVAAFIFGKVFGRHLICPSISPRKTWEGSLGAIVLSLVLPWWLRFSFPHFSARQLLLTGLIVGVAGQVGDLTFSARKRRCGIKDWGVSIAGHGGVLDRINSLVFVAPLFHLLAG